MAGEERWCSLWERCEAEASPRHPAGHVKSAGEQAGLERGLWSRWHRDDNTNRGTCLWEGVQGGGERGSCPVWTEGGEEE